MRIKFYYAGFYIVLLRAYFCYATDTLLENSKFSPSLAQSTFNVEVNLNTPQESKEKFNIGSVNITVNFNLGSYLPDGSVQHFSPQQLPSQFFDFLTEELMKRAYSQQKASENPEPPTENCLNQENQDPLPPVPPPPPPSPPSSLQKPSEKTKSSTQRKPNGGEDFSKQETKLESTLTTQASLSSGDLAHDLLSIRLNKVEKNEEKILPPLPPQYLSGLQALNQELCLKFESKTSFLKPASDRKLPPIPLSPPPTLIQNSPLEGRAAITQEQLLRVSLKKLGEVTHKQKFQTTITINIEESETTQNFEFHYVIPPPSLEKLKYEKNLTFIEGKEGEENILHIHIKAYREKSRVKATSINPTPMKTEEYTETIDFCFLSPSPEGSEEASPTFKNFYLKQAEWLCTYLAQLSKIWTASDTTPGVTPENSISKES